MSRNCCIAHTLQTLQDRCDIVGDCWLWKGATDGHGKPSMHYQGKVTNPRRVARQMADGQPLPPGTQVVPACRNQLCISPDCSVKTDAKGRARIAAKAGAFSNPAKNRRGALTKRATSWITDSVVAVIKAAASGPDASRETGVSLSHCKAIRRGTARKDYASPWAGLTRAEPLPRIRSSHPSVKVCITEERTTA